MGGKKRNTSAARLSKEMHDWLKAHADQLPPELRHPRVCGKRVPLVTLGQEQESNGSDDEMWTVTEDGDLERSDEAVAEPYDTEGQEEEPPEPDHPRQPQVNLTRRQRQVVELAQRELNETEIAAELGVKRSAVSRIFKRIMEKTDGPKM